VRPAPTYPTDLQITRIYSTTGHSGCTLWLLPSLLLAWFVTSGPLRVSPSLAYCGPDVNALSQPSHKERSIHDHPPTFTRELMNKPPRRVSRRGNLYEAYRNLVLGWFYASVLVASWSKPVFLLVCGKLDMETVYS